MKYIRANPVLAALAGVILGLMVAGDIEHGPQASGEAGDPAVHEQHGVPAGGPSMIRILANPESYHGRRVTLHGYLFMGRETGKADGLYLTRDHAEHRLTDEAFGVEFADDVEIVWPPDAEADSGDMPNRHYVAIHGTLDTEAHGHFNVWQRTGTIRDIDRVAVKPNLTPPQDDAAAAADVGTIEQQVRHILLLEHPPLDPDDLSGPAKAELVTELAQRENVPLRDVEGLLLKFVEEGRDAEPASERHWLAASAIEVLGDIGAEDALRLLKEIAEHDENLRARARRSIKRIQGAREGEESEPDQRQAAPDAAPPLYDLSLKDAIEIAEEAVADDDRFRDRPLISVRRARSWRGPREGEPCWRVDWYSGPGPAYFVEIFQDGESRVVVHGR